MNKVYIVIPIVLTWLLKAIADGKISASEIMELATQVASVLGVKLEIDLPGDDPKQVPTGDRDV